MTSGAKPPDAREAVLLSRADEVQLRRGAGGGGIGRIIVIADDLTGACDSGVAFLRCARRVRVALDAASWDAGSTGNAASEGDPPVWAFTTDTRDGPEEQASARVAECMARLGNCGLIFKKVDSAARGHWGVEIGAALLASGAACALVAPAFPEAGRTVEGGVLRVRDWSGQDSRIQLRDVFAWGDACRIGMVSAGQLSELEEGIARALTGGVRVLLCDAETQEDLDRLATAGLRARKPLLWAGSAGLAHALAHALPAALCGVELPKRDRLGRTLLFAGSSHPVTSAQIAQVEKAPGAADRATRWIPNEAASEQEVVDAFGAGPVGALALTGGDTAAFVLRALEAKTIELAGEVARGIPWGVIEGGIADGCVVVTKSGGFGEPDALVRAFEFCEGKVR